ncbi:MAG: lamin tail domain-containing protein [Chloroflexaceae bacterium]|nr:lamin tail domain-containing protein [Chloroflexaceae bacterium]
MIPHTAMLVNRRVLWGVCPSAAYAAPPRRAARRTPRRPCLVPARYPQPPAPPPPTYNACQSEPNPDAAPNFPIQIVGIDKKAEVVELTNRGDQPINLDGWRMCSLRGAQQHPISGVLQAGETRIFVNSDGNIWNNSERDDGALYDPEGRLISYWRDN